MVLGGKSVGASRHGPRSKAMTSSPASVSSCARIEPVQPRPIMTTSFLGRLRVTGGPQLRLWSPFGASGDTDRRQREALVVTAHPVEIVIAGTRIAYFFLLFHFHVLAIIRIG